MSFFKNHFKRSIEILQLILFMSIPTLLLLVYTRQYVDMASLKRQMHTLNFKKKELESRNKALKNALGKLARKKGYRYWQSYQEFRPYEKNKVIKVKLPSPLEEN